MNSRSIRRMVRLVGGGVVILCSVASRASAQQVTVIPDRQARVAAQAGAVVVDQKAIEKAADEALEAVRVGSFWEAPRRQNVPQDVRIMQTIVNTALRQVEQPPLPKALAPDSTADSTGIVLPGVSGGYVVSGRRAFSVFGGGDVSGFYMKGYGYLFTVSWHVGSNIGLYNAQIAELATHGRSVVLDRDRDRSKALSAWSAEYRRSLSNALRDVIAGYGSTLRRAQPGEAITFIADFGGGDSAMVTMTVKADALHGSNVDANRAAIQVSEGQAGMSERMQTQLKIMSQIIDTSLNPASSDRDMFATAWSTYYGGQANPQYVPGYGVIFRKNARLNTARTYTLRPGIRLDTLSADSLQESAHRKYQAHLDTLALKTANILANYGPTLTELKDDDWVGIYYDVGSAAALLYGGMDNFLVQARMRDIRQAAGQADPAGWLAGHLVTNEKQETD